MINLNEAEKNIKEQILERMPRIEKVQKLGLNKSPQRKTHNLRNT